MIQIMVLPYSVVHKYLLPLKSSPVFSVKARNWNGLDWFYTLFKLGKKKRKKKSIA